MNFQNLSTIKSIPAMTFTSTRVGHGNETHQSRQVLPSLHHSIEFPKRTSLFWRGYWTVGGCRLTVVQQSGTSLHILLHVLIRRSSNLEEQNHCRILSSSWARGQWPIPHGIPRDGILAKRWRRSTNSRACHCSICLWVLMIKIRRAI